MRRVASLSVLLVMASVASSASIAATGVRAQAKGRIISTSPLPGVVKSLSLRNAAQPPFELPRFNPDPTPIITEFYGPAKAHVKAAAPAAGTPEAAIRAKDVSAR